MGTAIAVRMTAAEFAALPDDEDVKRELIDGEVCEMAKGGLVHETVKGNILLCLAGFVYTSKLKARVQSETGYKLGDHDLFEPDISLVLGESLDPKGEHKISAVPDLAVEVVSSEFAARLNHKVDVLLHTGSKVVMVVYPVERHIYLHRAHGVEKLTESQKLEFEDLLPEFSVPVSTIFQGL